MERYSTVEENATHRIIAVDSDGEDLFVAEYAWSYEAAESELEACLNLLDSDENTFPDRVSDFRIGEV